MTNVWVSKSRKTGLTSEFFEHGFISMGWPLLPDISEIQSKEELTKYYDAVYPGETKMQLANHIGQIWKFVQEVKIGDLLIFPDKEKSTVQVEKINVHVPFLMII